MPRSAYGTLEVGAKSAEVIDYHRDQTRPGKPLHLLVPGGVVALATLATMVWTAYCTWYEHSLGESSGVLYLVALALVYTGSVFLFSYGYELYDVPRALRLTAILVFLSVAAVIILAVLLAILGRSRSDSASDDSSSSSGAGGVVWDASDLDLDTTSAAPTSSEPATTLPQPVICPHCGGFYVPADPAALCPHCRTPQS